jgi:hypothetical protein
VLRLRHLVLHHRHWAALLLVLALAFKLAVPAGLMTVATGKTIMVELCTGTGPATVSLHVPGDGGDGDAGKSMADQPCAFAGLAAPALAAADPVILESALRLALLLALLAPAAALLHSGDHLRPPLRGPPARV